jgi:FAD/FMN-containing dehydrogenase
VEDGIVLSLARMNTIRLDIETTASDSAVVSPPTTIATFGPAALTKEVIFQALVAHGYAGVVGACGDVAESGFILGGGFGFQSRHRGLGLDNVVGMRVVLANGAVQEIGGDDDLFWAMRGAGGGNFGVVTQLRYQLHKTLDTQVVAHVDVLFQDLPYVMHRIGELSRDAHLLPSEICVMMDERHGTDGIGINFLWFSLDDKREVQVVVVELKNVLDSILTKATPAVQYNVTTQRFSWSSYFNFWKADSRMSSWDNPYAQAWCGYLFQDNNTIAVWADISNQLSKILEECPHLYPDVELYGGAISQVPWNATAFPYRKAVYNVGVLLIVPENNDTHNGLELYHEQVAKVNAWWPSVSQYLTGTYVNYPMASLNKNEYASHYWGDNLERLVHIKQKYDPWNDFAFEQSVPMQL